MREITGIPCFSVMKGMHTERIDVITYSGRKGDERPATFILRGLRIDVVEIMDSWIEEGLKDRARKRFFRVKGSDKNTHRIILRRG